jgi:hypothetical protein
MEDELEGQTWLKADSGNCGRGQSPWGNWHGWDQLLETVTYWMREVG